MTKSISDAQLQRLSDSVARHLGLHFPSERWQDLQRGVCAAAQECGSPHGLDHFVEELLVPTPTQERLKEMASHLTVGETYFFREKRSLEVLEQNIVPELIQARMGSRRAIRIWSAGCATGEEPYSVAAVFRRLMAPPVNWNVEILATDLNARFLQKASQGIYGEWSFRGTPEWVRNTYFEGVGAGRWAVASDIKRMVTFAQLNLMQDGYAPLAGGADGFDVIFCRNVLMYFTPDGMRKVVRQLYRSLTSNGWLIVSPTETSHELFSEFAAIHFDGVTLYRKSATRHGKTRGLPSVVRDEIKLGSPSSLPERRLDHSALDDSAPAIVPVRDRSQQSQSQQSQGQRSQDDEIHSETLESPEFPPGQNLTRQEQRRDEAGPVMAAPRSQNSNGHDPQTMLFSARACADQGNLAAALAWCDKAIAADKMSARAYYLRATILEEQGCLGEALFALKQTVYAEPQFVLGHFSLGNLAMKHGKAKESEKHFENVLLLLARYSPEDVVPESDGLLAGRLREMIASQQRVMTSIVPQAEVRRTRSITSTSLDMGQTRSR